MIFFRVFSQFDEDVKEEEGRVNDVSLDILSKSVVFVDNSSLAVF